VTDLLVALGMTDSKAQARRLLEQGGIEIDGQRQTERLVHINDKILLKVGKRQYLNVHVSQPAEGKV
jgi:tyrosyl-tRNA synthetase